MKRAARSPLPARWLVPLALVVGVMATSPLASQTPPSPADVLGYDIGEEFTDVAEINRYMNILADASDLVSVHRYGSSVEGRPLIQVLIASTAHRARLEEILAMNAELADPETSEARARDIISTNPAVVYMSYGVHGNERSSSEAAIWTVWDLASGAPEVAGVLDNAIVIIDPAVNPDGRDRFVNYYRQARAATPNPNGQSREHDEPWPGGRVNHYLFDLNRDWAWMTQPETRARLATWDRWNPQVHVDFHEMGANSSYFFFPPAKPVNPIFPSHTHEWARRFGEGNAAAFDREGWLYYTGDRFDLFYPGYGDSWPSLLGAIGMTYEQAGGGGLTYERSDGTFLTLADGATHHRVAGQATMRTAAEGRVEFLASYADFHRNVDEGVSDILLVPGDDPDRSSALVQHLLDQGIEVESATRSFRAEAEAHKGFTERRDFPAGTYLVRARQSRGRLAGALLEPEHLLEGSSSYDITSWSLPYAYGVEAHTLQDPPDAGWAGVTEAPGAAAGGGTTSGAYGYLMTPGFDAARPLSAFLAAGGRVHALVDTFTHGGRHYPNGTFFFPKEKNEELDRLIRESGLAGMVTPVFTGLTEGGLDLGTDNVGQVKLPKIALFGGEGTSSGGFGTNWFFLERTLGIPFDMLNIGSLGRVDLTDYDVIIAPQGGRGGGGMGEREMERLREWMQGGGTLIAVGGTAMSMGNTMAEIERRTALDEDEEEDRDERLAAALREAEERDEERWKNAVPGTVLKVKLDPQHFLSFGASADHLTDEMFVLSRGSAFEPDEGFQSAAYFPEGLERISGVISNENIERLDRSSWLIQRRMGQGSLILFADDPLFRMFWYSGLQVYANAILLGPAF